MNVATKASGFDHLRSLLNQAAGDNPAVAAKAFGGLDVWSMSRNELVAARLMGLPPHRIETGTELL
jgi:hypothetical protein